MATTVPSASGMDAVYAIAYEAPQAVRDALGSLGRTEDVRFSPDGQRLAIACYARNQLAVASVEIARTAAGPAVSVASLALFDSPLLREPHGVDWLDADTLVVANRGSGIAVMRLTGEGLVALDAQREAEAPGSVAARPLPDGRRDLLACNNWADTITRHRLADDGQLGTGEVVLHKWLDLPDGVAVSRDGRWIAVSNHNSHSVLVFDAHALHAQADPVGILRGVHYPHGLRFGADDSRLLVADAGEPRVHVFVRPGPSWEGVGYPAASLEVMDDETFLLGHVNPQEGGPKGIDVDGAEKLLVVTAHHTPLAFFDLSEVLGDASSLVADGPGLVRYELDRLAGAEEAAAQANAAVAAAHASLHAVYRTKTWRLTSLPRRLYAGARRAARRSSTSQSAASSATSSGLSAKDRSASSA